MVLSMMGWPVHQVEQKGGPRVPSSSRAEESKRERGPGGQQQLGIAVGWGVGESGSTSDPN